MLVAPARWSALAAKAVETRLGRPPKRHDRNPDGRVQRARKPRSTPGSGTGHSELPATDVRRRVARERFTWSRSESLLRTSAKGTQLHESRGNPLTNVALRTPPSVC